jgi:hypothetical protein
MRFSKPILGTTYHAKVLPMAGLPDKSLLGAAEVS